MDWFHIIMTTDYVRISVPFFLLAIAIEYFISKKQGRNFYRLNDTINSLSCGILNQFVIVLSKSLSVFCYAFLSQNTALFSIGQLSLSGQMLAAVALFFGVDFCYYWFHRCAHRINFGWATHVVHHQSEEYNLSTALRQGAFQEVFSFAFYLPLALLGFPLPWFLAMSSLNTTWQFWIHTRTIDKMPRWFEAVFNTPSHHRVHHGRNEKYLDRNHAGIFIIWDRMFGTFQAEDEPVEFGITTGLKSWNPLWAQVQHFTTLFRISWQVPGFTQKLGVWWKGPDWQAKGYTHLYPRAEPGCFFNPQIPGTAREKAALLFGASLIAGVFFLYGSSWWLPRLGFMLTGVILLVGAGRILEKGSLTSPGRARLMPHQDQTLS